MIDICPSIVRETVFENIPTVFLEGIGHCCNLFANAFRLYHEYYHRYIPTEESSAK